MDIKVPNEWTIFPVDPGTKVPVVEWNEQSFPNGTKLIGAKGAEFDGLGLATGQRSGVIVVDLDFKLPGKDPRYPFGLDGMARLLEMAPPDETFKTLTVQTGGGGVHLYYKVPEWYVKTSVSEVGPGIDIKGDGGYAVIPPSVHKSGNSYSFVDEESLSEDLMSYVAELPSWLAERIKATSTKGAGFRTGGGPTIPGLPLPPPPPRRPELPENATSEEGWKVIERAQEAIRKCPDGRRNATLFRIAAELGDWNHVGELSLDDARHALGVSIEMAGWGDIEKTLQTMENGFVKGREKERVMVVIGPNQEECCTQSMHGLKARADVYVVGNSLARDVGGGKGIASMTRPNLQEILSSAVDWRTRGKEGELKRSPPPDWAVSELYDRGYWEGLRVVEGFSSVPLLRSDGSFATEPGYDSATKVVLREDVGGVVEMTVEEAKALLEDVIADFPFADPSHRAGWFCALLTPLVMYAFGGPVPLFLFEASTAGSGKSLLSSITAMISSGAVPSVTMFTENDEEMQKRITSIARSPKPVVLLDNVGKGVKLGGPTLCAVLTSPDRMWSARLLGSNTQFEGKLSSVFFATSNNTEISEDMHRRVVPIRLAPNDEQPEHRTGFRHGDLVGYVREHRELLTSAALRLLAGFVEAGRPMPEGKAWGSYNEWHRWVVGTVAWLGYGTPDAAVEALRSLSATDAEEGAELVEAMSTLPGIMDRGLEVQEVFDLAFPKGGIMGAPTKEAAALRRILDNRFPKGVGSKLLGYLFRQVKDRVFGGKTLTTGTTIKGYRRWVIEKK